MNNNFFKKNKTYIIIFLLVVFWLGFLILIIKPKLKIVKSNYDLIQTNILDTQLDKEKLGKLKDLRNDFDSLNEKKDLINVLFTKDQIVNLAQELERISAETGNSIEISVEDNNGGTVAVSNQKKAGTKKDEEAQKLAVPIDNYFKLNLILVGDYNGLIAFMDKLKNMEYYNAITSFDIVSKKVEKSEKDNTAASTSSINPAGVKNNLIGMGGEREEFILNSKLAVIFYSLDVNDENK